MGVLAIRRLSQRVAKGVIIILVVAMGAGLFFVAPKLGQSTPDYQYHGPAVRVNSITLKDSDFQTRLNDVYQQFSQYSMYGLTTTEEEMREEALQLCISDLVIKSQIQKENITVSQSDVDNFFNRWAKNFPTDDERYNFYTQYGISGDKAFKEEIRSYLEEASLYLALADKKDIDVAVTDDEIKNAYATIDVSHILLGTTDTTGDGSNVMTDEEAKKKADEVYAKLQDGGDWTELAKEYSTDTSNKDNGGEIGQISINNFQSQYDQDFVTAALDLKAGEYSKPIKTQYGYHIIKVNSRTEASGSEFDKSKDEIRAELIYDKFHADTEQYQKWMDARTAEADVTILDPALRAYELMGQEKWTDAASFYEKAVQMKQHRWDRDVFLSAAKVFIHEKQWDNAIKYTQKALKNFPDDMELTAYLGDAYYQRNQKGDQDEGLKQLDKAHGLATGDIQSLTTLKGIYDDLKLTDKSKAISDEIDQVTQQQLQEQQQQQQQLEQEQQQQQGSASDNSGSSADNTAGGSDQSAAGQAGSSGSSN